MSDSSIVIRGAREHNLRDVDVQIPRDKLVVITGLSGSGKSSLAFDTIYAEGQRRYVESLSSYARQFLGQMDKPDLDSIDGLSPAVSIDQKTTSKNPRSTVGTVTEIYDYLRLLFARIGTPHCPECGREIERQTTDQVADKILEAGQGRRAFVLAPVVTDRKGEFAKLLDDLRREGFSRVRVDGEVLSLDDPIELDKKFRHTIEVVVDRIVIREHSIGRIAEAVERATQLASGRVVIPHVAHADAYDDAVGRTGGTGLEQTLEKQTPESVRPAFPLRVRIGPGRVDEHGLIGEHRFAARRRLELVEVAVRLFVQRELQPGIEQERGLAAIFRANDQKPGQGITGPLAAIEIRARDDAEGLPDLVPEVVALLAHREALPPHLLGGGRLVGIGKLPLLAAGGGQGDEQAPEENQQQGRHQPGDEALQYLVVRYGHVGPAEPDAQDKAERHRKGKHPGNGQRVGDGPEKGSHGNTSRGEPERADMLSSRGSVCLSRMTEKPAKVTPMAKRKTASTSHTGI